MTSTRVFRSSMGADIFASLPNLLPQFQSRQREQCEDQRGNPEAHDHLGFAPAQQFEMMMNRSHTENALPSQLERKHLQDDGQRFYDKDAANKKQQNFLLDDDGDSPEGPAQRQRADITHKNFGWMRVVPKESKRGAHERAAKNCKLADFRDVLNVEIRRPTE